MRTPVAAAVACLALIGFSHAANVHASIKKTINIPAQGLGPALQTLSQERSIHVVFISEDVDKLSTQGAKGELTVEEALNQLLYGTGLTYKYIDDETVSILPLATAPAVISSTSTFPSSSERVAGGEIHLAQVESASSQSSSETPEKTEPAPSSGGSLEELSTELTEIVVTAQRRKEYLQNVPISIEVLSGKDLDRSSARGVSDVLDQVGGVSFIQQKPGKTELAIRGVVPPAGGIGTSPVGYYLDEVPFAFITTNELPDTNAFDLERVEVLRGPQGTLYGVNALSGVVRVLTNDANPDAFEVKGRARISDTDHGGTDYNGDLAINVPLIPGELAIRGVASYSHDSGFINSVVTDPDTGDVISRESGINDLKAQSYRLKANYEPAERLSVELGLSRSVIDNGAPSIGFTDLTSPNTGDQPDKRVYNTYSLVAEYRWPSVSLISSTAYLDYNTATIIQLAPGASFFEHSGLRSFSQELRFASNLQGPWQWSAGGIYKDATEPFHQFAPELGLPVPFIIETTSKSYAVFGETTRAFADDKFELTAGARYFDDRLTTPTFSNFGDPIPEAQHANHDKVTGRLVFAYKPRANHILYASAATGFRSGGTLDAAFAEAVHGVPPLKPDSLITYEVGTKGALFDGTFTYEAAAYDTDWKDIQQILLTPPPISFGTGINAGRANGMGADGSFAYHPTAALTLRASLGWNDLRFDRDVFLIETEAGPSESLYASKDDRLNLSPEWTGSVSGSYRMATPMSGTYAVLSSSFIYRSTIEQRFLVDVGPPVEIQRFESGIQRVLNASVGLEGDRWSAQLYADNVTNDREPIYPPTSDFNIFQRPRTVGLQVSFNY